MTKGKGKLTSPPAKKKRLTVGEKKRLEAAGKMADAYARMLAAGSGRDSDGKDEIADLEDQMRNLLDELGEVNQRLAQLRQSLVSPKERSRQRDNLVAELVGLMAHPDVADVAIDRRVFTVKTKRLTLEHDGGAYDLGRIRIEFRLDGNGNYGYGQVRFASLDRKGPTAHPHVSDSGHPCLGNISESVIQIIGQGQLATAAYVCLDYLKSYAQEESYRPHYSINNWPLKR